MKMFVCVLCVCERQREREKGRQHLENFQNHADNKGALVDNAYVIKEVQVEKHLQRIRRASSRRS